MTLDEAIKHCEEVADSDCYNDKQFKCADEHRQLAEWLKDYKRMKEQEPTTKNDLGVDYISRQAVIDLMIQKWGKNFSGDSAMQESIDAIRVMPLATLQEPTGKNFTKTDIDAIVKAINAHWELIIDEIRAEIETEKLEDSSNFCIKAHNIAVDRVLQILDKYKAETEDQE